LAGSLVETELERVQRENHELRLRLEQLNAPDRIV